MKRIALTLMALSGVYMTHAQNVGIGTATPGSKVDVVQTETVGNSLELNHDITTNASSAAWIRNSGLGFGIHGQNLLPGTTSPVARLLQLGTSNTAHGLQVDMDPATTAIGIGIWQDGAGRGQQIAMPAGNAEDGLDIFHDGTGYSAAFFQGATGGGLYNDVNGNLGLFNVIRSANIGTVNLLTDAGGTGGISDLGVEDGVGYFAVGVDNTLAPTAGGDVFGFQSVVRTATATGGGVVSGAAYAGTQSGSGHGILITHEGATGRNAEFNITNAANAEPNIFAVNTGTGSVIVGQNQNNAIPGVIAVADFAYTGTDIADHIGLDAFSTPGAGWGIGTSGTGGFIGALGQENGAGALAGVFAVGDVGATGLKPFIIDHPTDPANKMLRHYALESDEVLNVYRGNVMLDAAGQAEVILPDYFDQINIDFSYQLTAIGTPVHPYVMTEITGNSFTVAGDPNTKVSWTVMAQRNDAYVQQNPDKLNTEIDKGAKAGMYLMPELHGQPATDGMFYREHNALDAQSTTNSSAIQTQIEDLRQEAAGGQPTKLPSTTTGEN